MSRLIDIDDSRNCYIGMDGEYETWNIDPNVIAEAQPEIIRCKDCKHWMRENVSDGYCSEMNMGDCDEDFYCGYAEVLTMEEFMDGQDMGNPEDGSL